jgi:hypothetical protein
MSLMPIGSAARPLSPSSTISVRYSPGIRAREQEESSWSCGKLQFAENPRRGTPPPTVLLAAVLGIEVFSDGIRVEKAAGRSPVLIIQDPAIPAALLRQFWRLKARDAAHLNEIAMRLRRQSRQLEGAHP